MPPFRCVLCDEPVETEEIVNGIHLDLYHPDYSQVFEEVSL